LATKYVSYNAEKENDNIHDEEREFMLANLTDSRYSWTLETIIGSFHKFLF
jgi:hypothetical protein